MPLTRQDHFFDDLLWCRRRRECERERDRDLDGDDLLRELDAEREYDRSLTSQQHPITTATGLDIL